VNATEVIATIAIATDTIINSDIIAAFFLLLKITMLHAPSFQNN
jgi:hypothetical protein